MSRMKTVVLVSLIASVFSLHAGALAQTQPRKPPSRSLPLASSAAPASSEREQPLPATKPAQSTPPQFEPVFFSADLPIVAYRANDPQKVYAWVEERVASLSGKPDQFSTSEDGQKYESALAERMQSVGAIPMLGPCIKKYDADRQVFEVKVLLSSIKDYLLKAPNPEALNLRRVTIAQSNLQRDTYSAQNAYGATIEVSRTSSDDYVLAFPAGPAYEPTSVLVPGNTSTSVRLPYRHTFNFLSLTAKLPPAEARANDKQITCMYVFSLEAPYAFRFKERETPTRDMPFERTATGFALFGRLDQVAVIHRETGVIYDQAVRSK